ncbi:MAG: carbohydrate ABC transporter permease [Lachnospirales bacterium]
MKKITLGKVIIYTLLVFWALTTIYPFFWVINNSFKTSNEILSNAFSLPANFTVENYTNAFSNLDIVRSYMNSVIISGSVTAVVVLLATMSAFAMTRYSFKGKTIVNMLFLGSLMIPAFSTIIPVFSMIAKLDLVNQHIAVIVPQVAGNLSFAIIVLMGYMKTLPLELEENAFLEGCSVMKIYSKIIVPLSIPTIASVAIFTFLWSYNDLFLQMIILRKQEVMPISALLRMISSQFGTDFGLMASSVTLVVVPVLIVYVVLQKYIIEGMTSGALKG